MELLNEHCARNGSLCSICNLKKKGVNTLLIILRILLSIIVFVLGGYSLISGNYEVMPYMMFSLGAMMLVMGIDEIMKDRKKTGVIAIIVSIFIFYVSVQALL